MPDANNVGRHLAMREAVGMVLRLHGVEGAQAAPRASGRRLSDAFTSDTAPQPDVQGVSGWHLRVTTGDRRTWGGSLDAVERAARLAGDDHAALVCYRRGEPVSRAYVLMSLAEFGDLIAEQGAAP